MSHSSADPASKLPSRAIPIERLIVMANQIAAFFAPYPDARRAEGLRNHLRTYWDPRMRQDLIDYVASGGEGLSPYVFDGVRLLTTGEDKKGYYGPPKTCLPNAPWSIGMTSTTATLDDEVRAIVLAHRELEGPLMPILHAVQGSFGYVPEKAVPVIAKELNLSRAEVHGVVTFYHDFRSEPAGRTFIKVCRAEACQAMGCEALVKRAEDRLGLDCGGTTADGRVTLETVYCLGLCATAPSAMVNGKVVGRLDAHKLDRILAEASA